MFSAISQAKKTTSFVFFWTKSKKVIIEKGLWLSEGIILRLNGDWGWNYQALGKAAL